MQVALLLVMIVMFLSGMVFAILTVIAYASREDRTFLGGGQIIGGGFWPFISWRDAGLKEEDRGLIIGARAAISLAFICFLIIYLLRR